MGTFFRCQRYRHFRVSMIAFATIALLPIFGQCQVSQTSAQFLLIAPDARGRSMGDGGSVFSNGAVSTYYNPALLVTSEEFSGEYNHCQYLPKLTDDLSIKNIYLSHKLKDWGYYGIGYTRLDYGKKMLTDEAGNLLGMASSYDYALGFWAAFSFDPDNSFGAGFKYIERHLADIGAGSKSRSNASTIAFDFGMLSRNHFPEATWRNDKIYYPGLRRLFRVERNKGLVFGVSVANLGKDLVYVDADQSDPLPKRLRLGIGYQAIDSEPVGLRLTVDATKLLIDMDDPFKEEWNEIVWSYGVESTFYYLLNFRLGRLLDREGRQRFYTVGFGLGPEWLRLDYSRVLDSDIHWNRRSDEYSISFKCNISPQIFKAR